MIITQWGKYKYLRMPMKINCAPDIFLEKMSCLIKVLELTRTYLDYLLCLTEEDFKSRLGCIKEILIRLLNVNIKLSASKTYICKTEIDYLGCVVTQDGIKPQPKT